MVISSGSGVVDSVSSVTTVVLSSTVPVSTPRNPIAMPVVSVPEEPSPPITTELSGVAPMTLYHTPIEPRPKTLATNGAVASLHPELIIDGVLPVI